MTVINKYSQNILLQIIEKSRKEITSALTSTANILVKTERSTKLLPSISSEKLMTSLGDIVENLEHSINSISDELNNLFQEIEMSKDEIPEKSTLAEERGLDDFQNLSDTQNINSANQAAETRLHDDQPHTSGAQNGNSTTQGQLVVPSSVQDRNYNENEENTTSGFPRVVEQIVMAVDPRLTTPFYETSFGGVLVNSLSYISYEGHFLANTSKGCIRIDRKGNLQRYFLDKHVKAVSVITKGKLLVLIRNSLLIYVKEDKTNYQAVYTIPRYSKLKSGYEYDCIGVSSPDPTHYVVSEKRTACLYVWNVKMHKWEPPFTLPSLVGKPQSEQNFKMCVSGCEMFVTTYHAAEVHRLTLQGQVIWTNNNTCHRPSGIAADKDYVYVCESEKHFTSVAVLDRVKGTRQHCITAPGLLRPYALAVGNEKVAVLDRYYKHNLAMAPIKLLLFKRKGP